MPNFNRFTIKAEEALQNAEIWWRARITATQSAPSSVGALDRRPDAQYRLFGALERKCFGIGTRNGKHFE